MTLYDYVCLCMAMYDYDDHDEYVWLCMTICAYFWLYMTMYDYVWLWMTMCDYVWVCMTMHEYVWLGMTILDYLPILNYSSNPPDPCKTGIVYGQALWIVERCSNEQDVEKHKTQNFKKKQISSAQQKSRKRLIFKKKQRNQTDKKVRLISKVTPAIQKWIRQSRKY